MITLMEGKNKARDRAKGRKRKRRGGEWKRWRQMSELKDTR